ncbi:hypothetical protein HCUR_00418 [Holospora curviuscula]|uniref:Uncharacterized protein n=1 Tax=Holospora curviuscula TaxID=1082868 RepID=A0A2S5RAA0_9PROT|nr:hypothetical protein HCUR_00418 [Holospora curviuscula]
MKATLMQFLAQILFYFPKKSKRGLLLYRCYRLHFYWQMRYLKDIIPLYIHFHRPLEINFFTSKIIY